MKPLLVAAALVAFAVSGCGDQSPAPTTIGIHYSRFDTETITAQAGVPLTITLRNSDPIEHEWIVGTAAVHERHVPAPSPTTTRFPPR